GAAVAAHGGSTSSANDLTFVAVFGLPTLAEDDPLRAARAALGIRSALAELNESLERDWGVRYALRIGVATGKTLVDPTDTTAAACLRTGCARTDVVPDHDPRPRRDRQVAARARVHDVRLRQRGRPHRPLSLVRNRRHVLAAGRDRARGGGRDDARRDRLAAR